MSRRRHRRLSALLHAETSLLAWSLLGLLTLGACGLDAESSGVPADNHCVADDECSSSLCDQGICVASDPEPSMIALELLPASSSGEAQAGGWIFDTTTIAGPETVDLVLPAPLEIRGDVTWNGEQIPALISFKRASPLPQGNPIIVRTTSEVRAIDDEEPAYSAEVVAGQTYEVTVQPSAVPSTMGGIPWTELLPPLINTFNAPAPDPMQPAGMLRATLPIVYPPLMAIDGRVLDTLEEPENDLIVRAVDVASGRTVSSTCLTVDGDFTITLPEGTGSFHFVVEGSESRPDYPKVVIDPSLLFPSSPVLLRIPALETVVYRGSVESEDGSAIQSAHVLFTSTELAGIGSEASFEATTSSADEAGGAGGFEVTLLPGSYDVIVTPSGSNCDEYVCESTEELAVLHMMVDVVPRPDGMPIQGRLFVVPERTVMGGSVNTSAGLPMFGVAAQAVARREPLTSDPAPEALYNRSSSADSDPTGLFDLRLDRGRFDLFLKSDPFFGFPWAVVPGLEVESVDQQILDDFVVGLPVPIRGVARDSSLAPLEGAEVRAHALIDDAGTSRSVLIGTATVGADGRYELLLPPSL